jgi:hypothetical protein
MLDFPPGAPRRYSFEFELWRTPLKVGAAHEK